MDLHVQVEYPEYNHMIVWSSGTLHEETGMITNFKMRFYRKGFSIVMDMKYKKALWERFHSDGLQKIFIKGYQAVVERDKKEVS